MDEPISSATLSGKHVKFSLLQMVAVTTLGAAAFSLCRALFLPPLGSSGLAEARFPAFVLVIALWFCRRGLVARLGSYTVVASLLSLGFFLPWLAQSDWIMGHTHGPPQLFVATFVGSTIGTVAGISWFVTKLVARQIKPGSAPALLSGRWRAARWLGNASIVVLALLSTILALVSIPGVANLSRTGKQLDDYVEGRLRNYGVSLREMAEVISNTSSPKRADIAEMMAKRRTRPDDEAAIPMLQKLMHDDDPRVRRAATDTLRRVTYQIDPETAGKWQIPRPNMDPQAMDAVPVLNDTLNDEDELVRQGARVAIDRIESRPPVVEGGRTVPGAPHESASNAIGFVDNTGAICRRSS